MKADQGKALSDEYERLGRPMDGCELIDLVRKVEVELSKNHTFNVLQLRGLAATCVRFLSFWMIIFITGLIKTKP